MQMQNQGRSPGAFLSANALKFIAIAAMLIDHTAHIFVPNDWPLYSMMRFVGRITGPVMFYFIAEGYHFTRNKNLYTLRLAVFALVSYLPFILAMEGMPSASNLLSLSVGYTLLLGHLMLRAQHEIKNAALKWALTGALIALSLPGDWSYIGMFMMLVFDYFRGDFRKQAFGYLLIMLSFGSVFAAAVYPLNMLLQGMPIDWRMPVNMIPQFGQILPITLLYFYNGLKGRGGNFAKWGFYAFYPAHLLILGIIRLFV
jgi:hypothetical protein